MSTETILAPGVATANGLVRRGPLILYALMVASWLFDFQSEGAAQGLSIQIFFLLSYGLFFTFFVLLDRGARIRIPGVAPLAACTVIFLSVSIASGLIRDQELYPVLRHALSVFIYLTAAYATARMVTTSSTSSLRLILGGLCLGFAVSNFFIELTLQEGIDVETIRYQILGTSSIAALGYIVLVLSFSLLSVEAIAGLSAVVLVLISVTRTYLVVIMAQAFILIPLFNFFKPLRLAIVLVIATMFGAALLTVGNEIFDRWVQRLYVSEQYGGIDPTLITRYYESEYMYEEFLSSDDKFLFGSGLAAETSWWLPSDLGGDESLESSIGFGHNQHLSLLFTAGLLGGGPLLFLQFLQGWQGIRFLRQAARYSQRAPDLFFLGAWGVTIILGTLAADFLSATFGNRGFSLWYGIGTGLLLGARRCLLPPPASKG